MKYKLGYRAWGVDETKLTSIGVGYVRYQPRQEMIAECLKDCRDCAFCLTKVVCLENNTTEQPCICHHAEHFSLPDIKCECGFWAVKSSDNLIAVRNRYACSIIGQVAMWGKIVEHELGYRAQFAYPYGFYLQHANLVTEQIHNLAQAWGVEILSLE